MTLPYDMGNAGDRLKHGVLAEFVVWQCERDRSFRFFDLFGGEPEGPAAGGVARRVRTLPDGALRAAQSGIDEGRYYGSGLVTLRAGGTAGLGGVRVLTADRDEQRRERLRAGGLSMFNEGFPECGVVEGQYDAYAAFGEIAGAMSGDDLVLLDPFDRLLPDKAPAVVPQIAEAARSAAVRLFALNRTPGNSVGRRFDALLERHLRGAWRMTCPPLLTTEIRGESRYHADVVLAARPLLEHGTNAEVRLLRTRLAEFAKGLTRVLDLPALRLEPRVVGG